MLDALRRGTGSWIVKGLLGLLVLSFAVWGIGRDTFSNVGGNGIASVGDIEISPREFTDEFQRDMRRLSAQFGTQLDAEQARQLGLHEAALQRLITLRLYDQAVRGFSLAVPDSVIAASIRDNEAFLDERGNFDRFRYEGVLRNIGLTPAYFEQQVRRDVLRGQVTQAITGGSLAISNQAKAIYGYRNEKRLAELAIIKTASIGDIPAADEAALSKHHQDNKARYTAPEYRAVTWVELLPEDLADDISINDDDIADEYENRLGDFITLEKREIDQLLFSEEDAAKAAHGKLSGGAAFGDVAADKSNLQGDKTDLGNLLKADLPEEIRDAAFGVEKGGFTQPVKSLFGWHILRAREITPGETKTLTQVSAELKRQIQLRRAAEGLYDMAGKLEDELAGGTSLDDAAQRFALKTKRAEHVDARGLDQAEKAVALPKAAEFLNAVFTSEEGAEPQLTETQAGGYFILRVDRIIPPALKPLANVREAVSADWKNARRVEAAAKKAADLMAALKGGGDFSKLAQEAGAEVKTTEAMTRYSAAGERAVSPTLLSSLFKTKPSGIEADASPTGDAHVVARLKSIEAASPGADAEAMKKLRRQLRTGMDTDLLAQFRDALAGEHEIKVNRRILEALF